MSEETFWVAQCLILASTLIIIILSCFIFADFSKERTFELEKLNCLKKYNEKKELEGGEDE